MKLQLLACLCALAPVHCAFAQIGGGAITDDDNNRLTPARLERLKRTTAFRPDATPEERAATYVEAAVLINVRADEYVAVFALTQREKTVAQADAKMSATLAAFRKELKQVGIKSSDFHVDSVLQNRVYSFTIEANQRAREELVGFEIKKNVSIRLSDKRLLDPIIAGATRLGIYDLVKVDYVVKDVARVQNELQLQTARVLQAKIARYNTLGVKLLAPVQVIADEPSIYYPTSNYSSYQSAATNDLTVNRDYTVEKALTTNTFYFNPLDGNGFDVVVNPVIMEPVVQFTSYLKVKCDSPIATQTTISTK